METYLTTMFWLGILGVVMRSIWLLGEHPRVQTNNIGTDVFALLINAGFLAWVSYLKYWT